MPSCLQLVLASGSPVACAAPSRGLTLCAPLSVPALLWFPSSDPLCLWVSGVLALGSLSLVLSQGPSLPHWLAAPSVGSLHSVSFQLIPERVWTSCLFPEYFLALSSNTSCLPCPKNVIGLGNPLCYQPPWFFVHMLPDSGKSHKQPGLHFLLLI